MHASSLPPQLPKSFSTAKALELGVTPQRLRANDLERPFRGARVQKVVTHPDVNRYEQARLRELSLIHALGSRLVPGQFLSHRSAALMWKAPVPSRLDPELHVTAFAPQRTPRIQGVRGHRARSHRAQCVELHGVSVATPATVFATSGLQPLAQLVALGDYFLRVHRAGVGRRNVGRPPIATLEELRAVVEVERWRGMKRLRYALLLLREDSWSPRESSTRLELILAGLPEPELNVDLFDTRGRFLGCLDMVYRRFKVAVEYQGSQHGERYAEDVERYEALREAGWWIIQVTKTLAADPAMMTARVAHALRVRGWGGGGGAPGRSVNACREGGH